MMYKILGFCSFFSRIIMFLPPHDFYFNIILFQVGESDVELFRNFVNCWVRFKQF